MKSIEILRYFIRVIVIYIFSYSFFNNIFVGDSLYTILQILKWSFFIYFFFLFPNKFLKLILAKNHDDVFIKPNMLTFIYKLIIYVGLVFFIFYGIIDIIFYVFPNYVTTLDFDGNIVKRPMDRNFKVSFYPIFIWGIIYLPIVFFANKISNRFRNKTKDEGTLIQFFDVFLKASVIFLLIHNIYPQITFLSSLPRDVFGIADNQNEKKFLINLFIILLVSYVLLFQSKQIFRLLGLYTIQKYLTMNNIDLLQERTIYRITIMVASATILILFIVRLYAVIDMSVFRDMRIISRYEPWMTIIVLAFCISAIYFNKRIADFLVKN